MSVLKDQIVWQIRPLEVRAVLKQAFLPDALTPADVVDELSARGVLSGYDYAEIARLCGGTPGSYVVARGTPPEEGKDGWIEWLVPTEPLDPLAEAGEEEAVDYRERRRLPSVQAGTLLARTHPPEPGRPGVDVRGAPILPRAVHPVEVIAGEGVVYDAERGTLSAERSGMLFVQQSRRKVRAAIGPLHTHRGDVSLSSGNIRFAGSVEVIGNVEEGMVVEAKENVHIRGQVTRARIVAGGYLSLVGEAFFSELVSGVEGLSPEALTALGRLDEVLIRLARRLHQLQNTMQAAPHLADPEQLRAIVLRLLDADGAEAQAALKVLRPVWSNITALDGDREVFYRLWALLLGNGGGRKRLPDLPALTDAVRRVHDLAQAYPATLLTNSGISVGYAQASRLVALGDVVIGDKGAFQSAIEAHGQVIVRGPLRGGRVFAAQGAFLREAGSSAGVMTAIVVGRAAEVNIDTAHPDVEVTIGAAVYRFRETRHFVRLKLGEDGHIELTVRER
ncbi:MAG: DUF342 domain-containing protein [Hydrogenibacillus sp.]|nr:DUF342 domain-containing protein [Hydrogenibacillus sp.]